MSIRIVMDERNHRLDVLLEAEDGIREVVVDGLVEDVCILQN